MVKLKYDSVHSLPLVPDKNDGQLLYPEFLYHDGLNAVYKGKASLPEVSKTPRLQSSRGYFTDGVTFTNLN